MEEDIKEEIDPNTEESAKKKHLEKKRKLKEMFDAEYDEGESTYFDDLKGEMQKQAQVRKLVFFQPCFKAIVECCECTVFRSLLPDLLLCLAFGLLGRDADECVYSSNCFLS